MANGKSIFVGGLAAIVGAMLVEAYNPGFFREVAENIRETFAYLPKDAFRNTSFLSARWDFIGNYFIGDKALPTAVGSGAVLAGLLSAGKGLYDLISGKK